MDKTGTGVRSGLSLENRCLNVKTIQYYFNHKTSAVQFVIIVVRFFLNIHHCTVQVLGHAFKQMLINQSRGGK